MQWVQDPRQSNVDNLNNVRHETSRHFRNKNKEYLKAKSRNLKLTVRSKILRTCTGASVTIRRVTSLEYSKDKKDDFGTDSHSILASWRNHFSQLLNIHGVNDVRQRQIHTTETLVPEPTVFEVELAIEKINSHK